MLLSDMSQVMADCEKNNCNFLQATPKSYLREELHIFKSW